MSITKIFRYRRPVIFGLMFPLIVMFVQFPAHAWTIAESLISEDEIRVNVVDVRVQDQTIVIIYDLIAAMDETYEVNIVLLREKNPSFQFVPRSVAGYVGEGKFAGTSREIKWNYKNDLPRGLEGEGFYFEITVNKVGGGSPWLYIVLGAAAAGGGAAALLLGKKGTTQTGANELPGPPARPQ